jgi:hypothetical protein
MRTFMTATRTATLIALALVVASYTVPRAQQPPAPAPKPATPAAPTPAAPAATPAPAPKPVIPVATNTVTGKYSISDGTHTKMLFADNNTLWIGSQYCATGEVPDVIAWKSFCKSILVECKVSRADFLSDPSKPFRLKPEEGMGSQRLYMAPAGMIRAEELILAQYRIQDMTTLCMNGLATMLGHFDLPDFFTPEFPAPIFLTTHPELGDVSGGVGRPQSSHRARPGVRPRGRASNADSIFLATIKHRDAAVRRAELELHLLSVHRTARR